MDQATGPVTTNVVNVLLARTYPEATAYMAEHPKQEWWPISTETNGQGLTNQKVAHVLELRGAEKGWGYSEIRARIWNQSVYE